MSWSSADAAESCTTKLAAVLLLLLPLVPLPVLATEPVLPRVVGALGAAAVSTPAAGGGAPLFVSCLDPSTCSNTTQFGSQIHWFESPHTMQLPRSMHRSPHTAPPFICDSRMQSCKCPLQMPTVGSLPTCSAAAASAGGSTVGARYRGSSRATPSGSTARAWMSRALQPGRLLMPATHLHAAQQAV